MIGPCGMRTLQFLAGVLLSGTALEAVQHRAMLVCRVQGSETSTPDLDDHLAARD